MKYKDVIVRLSIWLSGEPPIDKTRNCLRFKQLCPAQPP